MLRVYLDSNIFRFLKISHPYHKAELLATVEAFKDKLIFCYSDAHLDDLKESQQTYRESDLKFMEKYVKDNYFTYNHIGKKGLELYLATPLQAFANKDYAAAKTALSKPFDIDHLLQGFDDTPETAIIKDLLKDFYSIPISTFGSAIDTSALDEKSKEWMDKIMPGYNPSMDVDDLMNSVTPFGIGMLEDEKKVRELRKYIGEYLNKDDYSFEKWGLAFNEKLKETGIGSTFLEMIDNMLTDNQKNDFYLRFTYAYTMLEMYNITQERKSDGGLKRFDFDSLNTDATHAYFASHCDYLVTDDKGMQVKASIVYHLFGFHTKVLSTEDFINHKSLITGQEETRDRVITAVKHDLNNSFLLREKTDIATGTLFQTYKTTHCYFNYFNRMQRITNGKHSTLALYCERGSHGNFIMPREVEILVQKTIVIFGIDDEDKGLYNFCVENENSKDIIRKWTINDVVISLERSEKEVWGDFLCLSIDFLKT